VAVAAVAIAVVLLSVQPVLNLLSGRQLMNASFDRLQLVNTYGAFGSVGSARAELIIEGTSDETVTRATRWQAYELPCKPGDPGRRPCLMSPYHRRLDWLLWFAAMGRPAEYPWTVHLAWKLLQNDRVTLGLFAYNPFPAAPPRHLRIDLYQYRFARGQDGLVWERTRLGPWLPPLSLDDEELRAYLRDAGWLRE
jgi:hypothetical protein